MRRTSFFVFPTPEHAIYPQAVLQAQFGNQFLQTKHLATQVPNLLARRLSLSVLRQTLLPGFQELLRQAVIEHFGNTLTPAQGEDALIAAKPFQHNPNLTFRRIFLSRPATEFRTIFSEGPFDVSEFCLICVPLGHYDEPEILRYKYPSICHIGPDVRQLWINCCLSQQPRSPSIKDPSPPTSRISKEREKTRHCR